MKCLLAVGACYLDTILNVEHYPTEDEKMRASSIIRRRGGNCPNTLDVLQQLLASNRINPISLALCAVMPSSSSPGYQELRSSFEPSIDLSHCICREDSHEPASSYIIRSRAVDSRTVINYNGLREMTAEEIASVADELGEEMVWCHFEGRIPNVTLSSIQYLRQHHPSVKISVEVEKPAREGLQDLAALADVVFYSKSWAQVRYLNLLEGVWKVDEIQGNGYRSAEECLRAQAILVSNASLLICTWGESGVSALERRGQTYTQCSAFKAEGTETVDTIGAGDTLIAGMLFGLTCREDGWTLIRKLRFANELAGRKVVQEGLRGLGSLMQHSL